MKKKLQTTAMFIALAMFAALVASCGGTNDSERTDDYEDNPVSDLPGAMPSSEAEVAGYWAMSMYVYYFDGAGSVTVYYEHNGSVNYIDKYQITSDEYRDYVELVDADDGEVYRVLNIEGDGVMYAPDYDEEYIKLDGNPFE